MNSAPVFRWADAHLHAFQLSESDLTAWGNLGLDLAILGGIEPSDWEQQCALVARFSFPVVPCFGLHPWWVLNPEVEESRLTQALDELRRQLQRWTGPGAVGELGLDRFGERRGVRPELSVEIFSKQLALAQACGRPIVLHAVDAHGEILRILQAAKRPSGFRGIVHRFSGTAEVAQLYRALGLRVSVGLGFLRAGPRSRLRRAVLGLNPGEVVFESDAPDGGLAREVPRLIEAFAEWQAQNGRERSASVWSEAANHALRQDFLA